MKRTIKLTESDFRNIVKKALRESYVDYNFGASMDGDFANALYKAYSCASSTNRDKLMQAFPEYFDKEQMFGNDDDPFDYRDFPYKDAYDKHWKDWKTRNHK